ncbi:MAG: leucine-rich repeat domain-containing protein [Verrucomicrobiota bacterium]|jgi:hypothetical protein
MSATSNQFSLPGGASKKQFPVVKSACATKLLPLLLLLTLPAVLQAQFTYMINYGAVSITGYTGSLATVTIPSTINALPVTTISDYAFYYRTNLTGITIPNSVTNIEDDAFGDCTGLTSVTIPGSVASLGSYAFASCSNLTGLYFQGDAPSADWSVFEYDTNVTAYYLPGTTGWGDFSTNAEIPAVLWNVQVQTSGASFGVQTNQFGFTITGNSGFVVVVEACTNLANPVWSPLQTNTLTGAPVYFSDPQWTNYARRFYGLGVP